MAGKRLLFTTGSIDTPSFPRVAKERDRRDRAEIDGRVVEEETPLSQVNDFSQRDQSPLFEPEAASPSPSAAPQVSALATAFTDRSGCLTIFQQKPAADVSSLATPSAVIGPMAPPILSSQSVSRATSGSTGMITTPARAHYRDHKQVKREIWQPGDGDGDYSSEYFGGPIRKRWRFFQSSLGPFIKGRNEPPKYVILDDQAVYDILQSKLYSRPNMARFWSHDISKSHGNIRNGRPNRGRPALVAPRQGQEASTQVGQGENGVVWALTGEPKKAIKYHLTGERGGYTAVEFPKQFNRPTATPEGVPLPVASDQVDIAAAGTQRQVSIMQSIEYQPYNDRSDPSRVPKGHSRPKISKFLYRTPSPPMRPAAMNPAHGIKRTVAMALGNEQHMRDNGADLADNNDTAQKVGPVKKARYVTVHSISTIIILCLID